MGARETGYFMKITHDLLFLTREQIETYFLQNIEQAFHEIKQAYRAFREGKATNPPSSFLWYDETNKSRIIALPACIEKGDKKTLGIKWISSCPNNIKHDLPRASALIILNDDVTGFPVAVLEGATISALRTALSALIAVEHLHPGKTIETLGIVGCGRIASQVVSCLRALGWTVNSILLYDLDKERSTGFASKVCPDAISCQTLEEVTLMSSVLLLTTTAVTPYLFETESFKKDAVILNLSLRDLGPAVILDAFNIVDDIEHVLHANTSPHLAFLQCGHKRFIHGVLTSLMDGEMEIENHKIKIFSPMGMGILDLALANLVYTYFENHVDKGCIKDFF
jgi:ornithine cyclodeaminase